MFASVLIANRGEIACRIIRTARRLGMRTIAVYSRADANALHVRMADEAHCIGPATAAQSYLCVENLIAAAQASGAECIHPGYGFLSENAGFAEACAAAGIVFVGPPQSAIRTMGLKDAAKTLMREAGVPVTPGYDGADQSDATLLLAAETIGFPVLIKAVAGGGGKGMRRVGNAAGFPAALESARREAQAAFGNPRVLIEEFVAAPRHIEVQVMADTHGNVLHLYERDCSLQRRHQKVIEEAPAPHIGAAMRMRLGEAAVVAARAVNYTGAGTVEFIASGEDFYFMEMNTRLQVEHPVTEAVTGLDLVDLQFRVAAGERLPLAQADIRMNGHAIEARLYAEDPRNDFLPSTGRLSLLRLPEGEGVRVDAGVEEGDSVSPHYDPMIAKIIAHGPTRDAARARLEAALAQTRAAGPKTNADFLHRIVASSLFASGRYDTSALASDALKPKAGMGVETALVRIAALALARRQRDAHTPDTKTEDAAESWSSPWDAGNAFQLDGVRRHLLTFTIDGKPHEVQIAWQRNGVIEAKAGGNIYSNGHLDEALADGTLAETPDGLFLRDGLEYFAVRLPDYSSCPASEAGQGDAIAAPMHGRVTAVHVAPGQTVVRGQRLAIVEAMKMEHVLASPRDGVVESIAAKTGAQVAQGAVVVRLAPSGLANEGESR
ncbi:MAG: acetyl-CoA carboxylase biotin carboxylase subunit [Beijerinckiaceae bacterium]